MLGALMRADRGVRYQLRIRAYEQHHAPNSDRCASDSQGRCDFCDEQVRGYAQMDEVREASYYGIDEAKRCA